MNRVFNNVFVRGSLFDTFDRTEDGNPIYGESWGIYAENDYGERLLHTASDFCDLKKYDGPRVEGEWEPDWSHDPKGIERAERFAERVQAHIDAGGAIDPERWYHADPRYGSHAYGDSGQEEKLIEWERAQG
tara:strand:- start:2980 stop:3375 length:396 start_codon:yes stop_codon:yes gene_type:complete